MSGPAAVILAAGAGRRAGGPKLRLRWRGRSFLRSVAAVLKAGGIDEIVCVVSGDDRGFAAGEAPGCVVAVNPDPERGMSSSLAVGLAEVAPGRAVLVAPVDHPFVAAGTVRRLVRAAAATPGAVVKPQFRGRSGHPIVIPPSLAAEVAAGAAGAGLDELIRRSRLPELRIDVADPGVLRNINEPADLAGRQRMPIHAG